MTSTELQTLTQAELVAWMKGTDIPDDDNTDELTYELALRILQADDEAAVLARDDVRPVASLIGSTFLIRSVNWRKSTKSEDGAGRYALLSCTDTDGVNFLTSCGATKVMLQVRKAELAGWLPWKVELTSQTTSNNRMVFELTAPRADF